MTPTLFGRMTPSRFLQQYWQKQPLLVRGAFPNFQDPVTPDELAGLSLERDADSRLVMERGGRKPWEVTLGPQQAARLRRLPPSHWTLLVQGVDRFIPGVAAMLDGFRFIPAWRVEDVMVSFAPRGGTVGPHIDSYDVFLIQGKGRRRWRLDPKASRDWKPGLDLRILKHFHAASDWVLEPGDMLYLPPDLAHYGVALEDCLTYSVGFRAPGGQELLAAAQERLVRSSAAGIRYSDPDLRVAQVAGELPRTSLQKIRRLMESTLQQLSAANFDAMVGELVTEPKGSAVFDAMPLSGAVLRSRLAKGASLARMPGSRWVFLRRGKATELFANGRRFPLTPALRFAAPFLTGRRHFTPRELAPHLRKPGFLSLLAELVGAGALRLESHRVS